jgi:ADP-heptose:LPS heptosyltransferase
MSNSKRYDRILIIKLGALGDIVRSLYSIYAIRKHFPNASIDLLTRKSFFSFCQLIPWFNQIKIAPYPKPWQIMKWWRFSKSLRESRYDLVVDLQCKPRTDFYQLLFGFSGPDWAGSSPFSTYNRNDHIKPNQHPYDIQRDQLKALGINVCEEIDLTWLSEPLLSHELPSRFVILIPGCSVQHPYKRWPASNYALLANKFFESRITSILIGTSAEKETIDEIASLSPHVMNLMDQTTMKQLASLSRMAKAVISNDTGPAQLTAMVGTPTFVIMSRVTIPERMLPIGPKVAYLKKDDIGDISVDEVWDSLKQSQFL